MKTVRNVSLNYMLLVSALGFFLIAISSCRFTRTIASIKVSENINIDSLSVKETTTNYKFLRLSKYGVTGSFSVTKRLDTNEILVEKIIKKHSTSRKIRDGRVKSWSKHIIYYRDSGDIYKDKKLYITKAQGRGKPKIILEKVVTYINGGISSKLIYRNKELE